MIKNRDKIIKFCQEYLLTDKFKDGCHNGLQVEGVEDVKKIIIGVSISQKLIDEAIRRNAQMIMVHHGFFEHAYSTLQIKGVVKQRLKKLLTNDINVAGFHLPLDAHPIVGNNISLCKLLGVKKIKPFDIGFIGELDKEILLTDFVKTIDKRVGTKSFVLSGGKNKIKKVAIVSGGASSRSELAAALGADVLICGDMQEWIVRPAEELGINVINAGHYNTEKLGIKNLGELVAKKFKVKVEFVDIPNEI